MNLVTMMELWAIKNNEDNPLDMLTIGEFDSRIDKTLLAETIAIKCGAMKPVQNTIDSYIFCHKNFFKLWKPQISKLLDTLDLEYNPLENFRREEELERHVSENTINEGNNKSNVKGTNEDETNNVIENKKSAYNEDEYQNNDREETTGNNTSTVESSTETDIHNERDRNFRATDSNIIKGLNGLFTPQNMLKQERETAEFNVYNWIVNKYMDEMFIAVY